LSTANSLSPFAREEKKWKGIQGSRHVEWKSWLNTTPKNKRIKAYGNPTFNPIKFGRGWPRY
jgi:hypothetical protein